MDIDCRPVVGALRLDRGSAVVEGIAAVAVVFILFTVTVQTAVLVLSHQAAEAVVATSVRRVADGSLVTERELADDLQRLVPGAVVTDTRIEVVGPLATGWARVVIVPPGPMFGTRSFEVDAQVPVVVAP